MSDTYNSISGPGKDQSQLTEGFRYLNVFNTTCTGGISGDWGYSCVFGVKATDDSKNDIKRASITNLNFKIKDKDHTINLGDSFEELSQYTLNTGVKGASYRFARETSSLPEISLIYGYAYPRWDNAFSIGNGMIEAMKRLVWGAKARQQIVDVLWLSANVVGVRDLSQLTPTDQAFGRNYVYSLGVEYKPLAGLIIQGESAFSRTSDALAEGAEPKDFSGNAQRIQAVGDRDPSRVVLEYERITPQFLTLAGAATPDREKAKATWQYKVTETIATTAGLLWFHDNLNSQKEAGTTHYYLPEAGIAFKELLERKSALLTVSYKIEYNERSGTMVKFDHIVNANYKDRFGIIDMDTNVGFNAFKAGTDTPSRTNELTGNTLLSSTHALEGLDITPSVQAGVWRSKDELAGTEDRTYEMSAGIGLNVAALRLTSTLRGGSNRLIKEVGDSTDKLFATASINWRPEALAKIAKCEDLSFYAKYGYNDMRFTTIIRDYRESSAAIGMNFQF